MQHLDTLWRLINAAGTVRDLASDNKTLTYYVPEAATLYIHVEASHIALQRHQQRHITIETSLQPTFGWRLQSEQDEAGVYLVAKRRRGLQGISHGQFLIYAPNDVHCVVRAENSQFTLADITQTLHISPDGNITTA
jgi:hypothetical protein